MKTSGESIGTLTRRQMLAGSGVALGGLAMSGKLLAAGTTDPAATATPSVVPGAGWKVTPPVSVQPQPSPSNRA